jgi:TolB-like protein
MQEIPRPYLIAVITLATGLSLHGQQNDLRGLASSLAADVAAAGKKTIAVVDFTDLKGNSSELGRFLAEEFSVALTRTHKGFEVVERNHLKAILTEHKLTATGLIDPATAKKLGQFTGADAIVTGSMTPFSEYVRVAVKVLSTDTARIIAADDIDLPKTQTIAELLGNDHPPSAAKPPASISNIDSPVPPPSSPVMLAEEFQFELLECKGMGNSVKCSFRITNRGRDRTLVLYCGRTQSTRAYDNFGNESAGDSWTIANRDSTQGLFAGVSVSLELIASVPVQASVLFSNTAASASSLSLISLSGTSYGGRLFNVSFRGAPIVR